MAEQGWQVTGLDAAVGAVARVRDQGLFALEGSLPHPHLRAASFDVVTMWHSLEHVHAPLAILREAFRLLVPGGKLVVAVPNRASWAATAFGPVWFGLDLPRHLTHFDPETLAKMLTASGFRVDEDEIGSAFGLAALQREAGAPATERARLAAGIDLEAAGEVDRGTGVWGERERLFAGSGEPAQLN